MYNNDTAILDEILRNNHNTLQEAADRICQATHIAVIGHVNPDGDCIGSQLGLKRGLTSLGKKVTAINDGPFDNAYTRQYEDRFCRSDDTDIGQFDLWIICDVSSQERVACSPDKIDLRRTIIIDHHASATNFGSFAWIDSSYVSASEMIFILLSFLHVTPDTDTAQYILDGILSDNGYYQHIRTHKYVSLYITYLLIGRGADPNLSYRKMFCNNTLETEQLFGKVIARTQARCDGKILWTYLYADERMFGAATVDLSSGMVFRDLLSVKGIKIAVYFKIDTEKGTVNVSLRSTDDIDVAKVAAEFGGGGHKVASGCTITGDFESVRDKVLARLSALV